MPVQEKVSLTNLPYYSPESFSYFILLKRERLEAVREQIKQLTHEQELLEKTVENALKFRESGYTMRMMEKRKTFADGGTPETEARQLARRFKRLKKDPE